MANLLSVQCAAASADAIYMDGSQVQVLLVGLGEGGAMLDFLTSRVSILDILTLTLVSPWGQRLSRT